MQRLGVGELNTSHERHKPAVVDDDLNAALPLVCYEIQ
jgi:hypothetical protein